MWTYVVRMKHADAIERGEITVMRTVDFLALVERACERGSERGARRAIIDLQDRKSFAAASERMTLNEVCEYLGHSRTHVTKLRNARRFARSAEEQEAAFAPEYGSGKALRFKKSEIDAWVESQQR